MVTPTRPLPLLLMTATLIFLLEGLIMLVLHLASGWVGTLSPWVEGALDASVLSVTVFPVLYILWFRPLSAEINGRRQAEVVLKRSHVELEVLVRQRSQELSRANESFRVLVQMAKDAVITSDKAGYVTFWNAEAERLWGYRAEDILGKPLTLLMPERFRSPHTTGFQRFLTTGQPHVVGKTVERIGLKKDGTEFPIDLSLASWSMEDQVFFTAIIRDITVRKQQEQALKQERNDLAKMNRVMMDREERILELKRQVNDHLKELGRPPQYQA